MIFRSSDAKRVGVLFIAISLVQQAASAQTKTAQDEALDLLVTQYNAQPDNNAKLAFVTSPGNFAPYFLVMTSAAQTAINNQLFHDFEEQRVDKQVSTAASSSASTSAANTGSVPWLFGFAVEHGALTQSVENNQIVFRGNIANAISALDSQDYMASYIKLNQENAVIRNIAKTSFSVFFNASQNSGATISANSTSVSQQSTLGGFSFHYDIYNHRDPRDSKWQEEWADVRLKMRSLPNATAAFRRAIEPQSAAWQQQTRQAFQRLGTSLTDQQVRTFLKSVADDLVTRFGSSPDVKAAAQEVAGALVSVRQVEDEAVSRIMHSPTVSFEYSYLRQTTSEIPTTIQGGPVALASPIPNLSNFNVIYNMYFVKGSQLTLNVNADIFNSIRNISVARLRDYRISVQIDAPLREIANVGKPILTFSGLCLDLLHEPLGQQVLVNGIPESRTGVIGLFQSKFTVPVKGSGIKIPISLTIANRSELIKEHDVRGAIGVTFDLDSIFSKPQ